jgi:hypothetical protein
MSPVRNFGAAELGGSDSDVSQDCSPSHWGHLKFPLSLWFSHTPAHWCWLWTAGLSFLSYGYLYRATSVSSGHVAAFTQSMPHPRSHTWIFHSSSQATHMGLCHRGGPAQDMGTSHYTYILYNHTDPLVSLLFLFLFFSFLFFFFGSPGVWTQGLCLLVRCSTSNPFALVYFSAWDLDSPTSTSYVAGITSVRHHALPIRAHFNIVRTRKM